MKALPGSPPPAGNAAPWSSDRTATSSLTSALRASSFSFHDPTSFPWVSFTVEVTPRLPAQ